MPAPVTPLKSMLAQIDHTQPLPFGLLHADEHVTVVLYPPPREDPQPPHDQDEFYFVANGTAKISISGEVREVGPGDAVFVPALAEHCFQDPSTDFSCWAVLYGPRRTADA